LDALFEWVGIAKSVDLSKVDLKIDTATNVKYQRKYKQLLQTREGAAEHARMVADFAARIADLGFGYSLDGFADHDHDHDHGHGHGPGRGGAGGAPTPENPEL
jgi:hypothetical protein